MLPQDLLPSALSIPSASLIELFRSSSVEEMDNIFEDLAQPICTCLARILCEIIRIIGMDPYDFEELRPYSGIIDADLLVPETISAEELQGILWVLVTRCSPTLALKFLLHNVLVQTLKQTTNVFPWYFAGGADSWSLLKELSEVTPDGLPSSSTLRFRCLLYGIWRLDLSEASVYNGIDMYMYPLKEACLNALQRVAQPAYGTLSSGVGVSLGSDIEDALLFQPRYFPLDMYALTTVSALDVAYLYAFSTSIHSSDRGEEVGGLLDDIERSWNAFERSQNSKSDWVFDEWAQRVLRRSPVERESLLRFPLYVPATSAVACQEASSRIDEIPRVPMSHLRTLREKLIRFIGLSDELDCKITDDGVEAGITDKKRFALLNSLAEDIVAHTSDLSLMQLQESSIIVGLSLVSRLQKRLHTVNENWLDVPGSVLSEDVVLVGELNLEQSLGTVTSLSSHW
jgi:hypothetical protein